MKTILHKITFAIISLTSLTACVRDVILDAGEKPQVVVECILSNEDVQELNLCFTKGASREGTEPLIEAFATLIDLTESKTVGQFVKGEKEGLWTLEYSAVPRHHYRLEVQVPGYDLIHAEDIMPESLDIWSFTLTGNSLENVGFSSPSPTFTSNALCAGTVYSTSSLPKYTLIYGMNYNPQTGRHEIADEIFTNLPVVDAFNITSEVYMPELHKHEVSYLPEVEAVKSLHADLKGAPKHKQYLLLEKESLENVLYQFLGDSDPRFAYDFLVFGSFTGDWFYYKKKDYRDPAPTEGYLVFESLSDNYLAFLRESIHFMQLKESSDMASIYLRDNVYTNVTGGLGIFAASEKQIEQCANVFQTIIFDDYFPDYGIISENGECRFADNERYEYPLWGPSDDTLTAL
ncbi:MAG: DUF4249 family protein [Bacteroidales bacterium]|nr:DUF4249 family protein [Bacteroidales bacterium]